MWRLSASEPKPMWYSMGFEDKRKILFFDVHNAVDSEVSRLLRPSIPAVKDMEKELRLSFAPPSDGAIWGFRGDIRKEQSPAPEYIRHVIELNPAKWAVSGPRYNTIPRAIYLLLLVLNREEYSVRSAENQLMIIDGICYGNDTSERGISGEFSPVVREWLRQFPANQDIGSIVDTMHNVYVLGLSRKQSSLYARYSFSAHSFGDGLLHLKVPGTCACIGPGTSSVQEDRGFRLSPHNIDSPSQQFAMLAGLGKLCELVRAEQRKRT